MALFSSSEPVFGLDIGHDTLKVAVVSANPSKTNIVSLSEMPIPKGAKTPKGIKEKDIIAQKVKEAKEQAKPHKISFTSCVSALPESLVFTKVIEMPKMTDDDLKKAMPFQISHAFPLSPDESYFDWSVLGAGPKPEMLEVLVVAAPKLLVEDFVYIVEKSGSQLLALETKPASLSRLFTKKNMKGGMIIADIGAIITGLDIIVDGNLHLTATVEVGGEQLKTDTAPMTTVAEEIKNLVRYYLSRMQQKTEFTNVVLCGGGANIPGLPETLTKLLKIPVSVGKPAVMIPNYNPTFATALGLALRTD